MQQQPPDEVFMYASWDSCKSILAGMSLKATPPNLLNDPFECLPGGYEGVTGEAISNRIVDPTQVEVVREKMIEMGLPPERVDACIRDGSGGHSHAESVTYVRKGLQNRDLGELVDELSIYYGIICFAKNPDCLLMWSHYAAKHQGVVIGFAPQQLCQTNGPEWLKVSYSLKRPKLLFDAEGVRLKENVIRVTSTKAPCWAYENEWRLVVRLTDCAACGDIRLWGFRQEGITRVILGTKAPDPEIKTAELRQLCGSIVVEQARMHREGFRLEDMHPTRCSS